MRSPLSRPALYLAFAAGTASSVWIAASPWLVAAVLPLTLVTLGQGRLRVGRLALLAALGICWGGLGRATPGTDSLYKAVHQASGPSFLWVRGTVENCEIWDEGCRADLKACAWQAEGSWRPCSARIRAYLPVPPPLPGSAFEASLRLVAPPGRTNPGQFDTRAYLERQGIALTATARAPELVRLTEPEGWRPLARYRRLLEQRLLEDGGPSGGALLAVLLGERGLQNPEQVDALTASGLYHLVALSGFNVGLLLIAFAGVAHLLGIHPRTRDLGCLLLLVAYGALVADQPSLSRALMMAGVFLSARLLARPQGGLLAWSAALAILLAWEPSWILDSGFQLTFAATLGILLLWDAYPTAVPRKGLGGALFRLHWVWLAALAATLPLVGLTFHRVSLLGWIATPLASLPLMAVQALGTAYMFGLAFVPGVHQVLGGALDLLTRLFLILPSWLGEGRWGSVFLPEPGWFWVALYALAFALLCVAGRTRRAGVVLVCAAVVGAWAWGADFQPATAPSLTVLDVGQASSQVLRWGGRTLLVDAGNGAYRGPTSGRTVVEPYLASMGVRQLEGLVLTHWDEDHAGSAPDLLRDLPTGFLAFPATDGPRLGLSRRVADLCKEKGIRLVPLSRGTRITLGGLDLEVLNPPDPSPLGDENDRSLVFRAMLGEFPVVFSGDLGAPGEAEMLRAAAVRTGFALLVPHHGSATSSSAAWVEAISPRIALLSLGRGNRFGHPSLQILGRFEARGVRVARTDLDGALLLSFGPRPLLFKMRDGDWSAFERQ
jgi:competence protein ComEC